MFPCQSQSGVSIVFSQQCWAGNHRYTVQYQASRGRSLRYVYHWNCLTVASMNKTTTQCCFSVTVSCNSSASDTKQLLERQQLAGAHALFNCCHPLANIDVSPTSINIKVGETERNTENTIETEMRSSGSVHWVVGFRTMDSGRLREEGGTHTEVLPRLHLSRFELKTKILLDRRSLECFYFECAVKDSRCFCLSKSDKTVLKLPFKKKKKLCRFNLTKSEK